MRNACITDGEPARLSGRNWTPIGGAKLQAVWQVGSLTRYGSEPRPPVDSINSVAQIGVLPECGEPKSSSS
jgi:hypothetical protein